MKYEQGERVKEKGERVGGTGDEISSAGKGNEVPSALHK